VALRAVIFDFDGVLVNSEPLHYSALREALATEGIEIDEGEYLRTYLAFDDWEAVRIALERHGSACDAERVDAIATRKAELFDELLPRIPFFPGARELLDALAPHLPLAIASGARRGEIERILEADGLRDVFQAIVGAEDVPATKPRPDPYLRALKLLSSSLPGLEAPECLVIEDSMAGIASGLAAGMRVLAVAHSYPPEQLASAHRVVPSLEGLTRASLASLF